MREVAFDESGNSGQNLLDAAQAGLHARIGGAFRHRGRQCRSRTPPRGPVRGAEGRLDAREQGWPCDPRRDISVRRAPGNRPGSPVHKEWMVAGKMVDLLWEPGAANPNYFYTSGLHRKLADMLFHQGPKEAGVETWGALAASVRRGKSAIRTMRCGSATWWRSPQLRRRALGSQSVSSSRRFPTRPPPSLTSFPTATTTRSCADWPDRADRPLVTAPRRALPCRPRRDSAAVRRGRETVLRFSDQEIKFLKFRPGRHPLRAPAMRREG